MSEWTHYKILLDRNVWLLKFLKCMSHVAMSFLPHWLGKNWSRTFDRNLSGIERRDIVWDEPTHICSHRMSKNKMDCTKTTSSSLISLLLIFLWINSKVTLMDWNIIQSDLVGWSIFIDYLFTRVKTGWIWKCVVLLTRIKPVKVEACRLNFFHVNSKRDTKKFDWGQSCWFGYSIEWGRRAH